MNAPQPSTSERELPPYCDSCQYCPGCDEKEGDDRSIYRFCEHGLGSNFVELNSEASDHDCPATAPLRRGARRGNQPGNPRTAQSGQIPSTQTQQLQDYTPGSAYTHSNNPAGQYPRRRDGDHNQPRTNRSQHEDDANANGEDLYEDMSATGRARTHIGRRYRTAQQSSRNTTFRGMVFGDDTVTHVGDDIGYDKPEGGNGH